MQNKILIKVAVLFFFIFISMPFFALAQAQTTNPNDYHLLEPIPQLLNGKSTDTTDPATFIKGLFKLAIAIATGLAVLMIIYGGFQYLSTDAWGEKNDAKGTIQNAIVGLLLTISSYLIISTINPDLVKFNFTLPVYEIDTKNIISKPEVTEALAGSNNLIKERLENNQVNVVSGILLVGLKESTIAEVFKLKQDCSVCDIWVTSATGGQHASGEVSHANGSKVDLRNTLSLTSYITNSANGFTQIGTLKNGDVQYKAPSGAIYTHETHPPVPKPTQWASHWDVAVN